jgi:tRNA-dihydrouridine synthase
VASIDINMGCPVKKVCKVGGGSAMMTELDKTSALVRGMINAVKLPITAKMRLGWDDDNLTAPDLARALEDVGVAAIFVHGRTREQGFGGRVNLAGIRAVVQAVKTIPVIGNGDVTTPQAAKHMLDETGCAGVSVGRGAFYDPWIFKRTLQFLNGARLWSQTQPQRTDNPANAAADTSHPAELLPEPSFDERVRVMCRHFELMIEVFGEELGCRMFRKVAPQYARRFGPSSEFNKPVVLVSSRAQFYEILEHYRHWRQQFVDDDGELKPRYRQPPMGASFMPDAPAIAGGQIAVPKGPVEVW